MPDMTAISDIDEIGINHNLKIRYQRDKIYVSFSMQSFFYFLVLISKEVFFYLAQLKRNKCRSCPRIVMARHTHTMVVCQAAEREKKLQ